MPSDINLLAVTTADFRTSKSADELNTKLMTRLGLKSRYEPARLALARSLAIPEPLPSEDSSDEEVGKAILGTQLFGKDVALWVSLIMEHAKTDSLDMAGLKEAVRGHWQRGIKYLFEEWQNAGEDFDRFLLHIAERAGLRSHGVKQAGTQPTSPVFEPGVPRPLLLRIGSPSVDINSREVVRWHLNGRGVSPHIALMGTLGTGKTRTGMAMIRQIHEETGCPALVFDMAKGDLAADSELCRSLDATVIEAPRVPVPLDVLWIPQHSAAEVTNAAIRFRESFARISSNRPGGAQLNALREAALRALRRRTPTTIADIRDAVREVYAEVRRKDDTVTATFNDLTSWDLFGPQYSPPDFFSRSWIIDVHEATETAQRFIVFLILDALYTYTKFLEDSPIDSAGNRALRLALAIDEARKILGYGHDSLIGLVRDSRSKGLSILLISQSPDDYDSEEDNFLENIGLAVSFRTNAMRPRALNAVLGANVDLGSLPNGVAVTKLPNRPGVLRIQAWE